MSKETLTQKRLKELLHYDPDTGVFTWVAQPSNRVRIGDAAGCVVKGYVSIRIDGIRHSAHRLVFLWVTGSFPALHVDHVDRNRLNNRWCNLREVTRQENQRNLPKKIDNKSGVTGVSFDKHTGRWAARIWQNGKKVHLGRFDTIGEAKKARHQAELRYGYHPNHGK